MSDPNQGLRERDIKGLAGDFVYEYMGNMENPVKTITENLRSIYISNSRYEMVGISDSTIPEEWIKATISVDPDTNAWYIDEKKVEIVVQEHIPNRAREVILDYLVTYAWGIMPDYDELPDNNELDIAKEVGKILIKYVNPAYFEELVKLKAESLVKLFKATLDYANTPVPEYKGNPTEGEA